MYVCNVWVLYIWCGLCRVHGWTNKVPMGHVCSYQEYIMHVTLNIQSKTETCGNLYNNLKTTNTLNIDFFNQKIHMKLHT